MQRADRAPLPPSSRLHPAVVITNQVQSDPGGGMTFVQDPKKPVGWVCGGCIT